MSKERQDFPQRLVTRKYLEQDGICATPKCGNPLDKGFHRNHISGDASDNSYENLELKCVECHHAVKDKEGMNRLEAHHEVERKVYSLIERMITESFDSKLSGANMERMMDGFIKMLQISRQEKSLDLEVEYPPVEIQLLFGKQNQEALTDKWLEGVFFGMQKAMEFKKVEEMRK